MLNDLEELTNEYRDKVVRYSKILEEPKRYSDKELAVIRAQVQAYLQMQKDLESLLAVIEDEQDSIHEDLMNIGNKHYKSGYGFIAMGVQEKYLLLRKSK